MKTFFLIQALVFCLLFQAKGQGHLPETSAFNVACWKNSAHTVFSGGYQLFLTGKLFFSVQGSAEFGSFHRINFESVSADLLANHPLLQINGTFYLNGGIGPSIAYESFRHISSLNYGGTAKLECETFFSDAFSLLLFADQTIFVKNDFERPRLRYGLGFRFFI